MSGDRDFRSRDKGSRANGGGSGRRRDARSLMNAGAATYGPWRGRGLLTGLEQLGDNARGARCSAGIDDVVVDGAADLLSDGRGECLG